MLQGTLYCIATPIGNLEDITARALRLLAEVNKIYAEDTRVTRRLLTHFGIQNELVSLHEHNEASRIAIIRAELDQGLHLALVSDAGTPLISDPGYRLVQELGSAGYRLVPIPGPSALVAALSVAGLPTERFTFEGFLPATPGQRRKALASLASEPRTLVFYESSHRIVATLQDMASVLGAERQVVLLRELTKLFESIYRGRADALAARALTDATMSRGEFVIAVAGHEGMDDCGSALPAEQVLRILLETLPVKEAAAVTARLTGLPKNRLYRLALSWQAETG